MINHLFQTSFLFYAHSFCCFFLTGLIWTIQRLHYPAYHFIDKAKFESYQIFHTQQISYIVAPVMLIELFSGLLLVFYFRTERVLQVTTILNLLTWAVTFYPIISFHNRLSLAYNANTVDQLIFWNWARTIFWSLRSSVFCYLFWTYYRKT